MSFLLLKSQLKNQCQQQPSSNMSGITSIVFVTNYIHHSEDIRKFSISCIGTKFRGINIWQLYLLVDFCIQIHSPIFCLKTPVSRNSIQFPYYDGLTKIGGGRDRGAEILWVFFFPSL